MPAPGWLGALASSTCDWASALSGAQAGLLCFSACAAVLGLLLQYERKDIDGAEAAYREAIKVEPGYAKALHVELLAVAQTLQVLLGRLVALGHLLRRDEQYLLQGHQFLPVDRGISHQLQPLVV